MKYINQLTEGESFKEIYFCRNKVSAQTKAGKNYYSLVLQDKTGTIDGKVWDLSNAIEHFETQDFILTEGIVTSYNGSLQLNIKRIRKADENEYDEAEYMPTSKSSRDDMTSELIGIINNVSEPHLKKLLESFFIEDEEFFSSFKKHSAAKSIHHGFIGGLMQHSLAVTRLCIFIADSYPVINKDLLVTAALCHDIGKVRELSDFPANDYTDEGQLLGHIVIGAMMVDEHARAIEGFPEKLRAELVHCILSHHGELEYGSPKKPALIEALVLSMADNCDAKIETFTEALEKGPKTDWLGFNRSFDSNIRRT